jgi:hypothetical protein
LSKNANRIVDGYEIQAAEAGGRKAWQVVWADSSSSPPTAKESPAKRQTDASLDLLTI